MAWRYSTTASTASAAYQLLDGYDLAVLVDAVRRGGEPGTLYVIEPEPGAEYDAATVDGHGMAPEAVLALVPRLGGTPGRVVLDRLTRVVGS